MRTLSPEHSARGRRNRGYVLVLVLLLTFVVGMLAAVSMQRLGAQSLSVRRGLDRYQEHHAARGLQDAIETWLQGQQTNQLADVLDDDGHAFTLELESGYEIRVYVGLGQEAVLADLSLVEDGLLSDAARVVRELDMLTSEADFARLTRAAGPVSVDVLSAEPVVLRAIAVAVAGDTGQSEDIYAGLVALRAQDEAPTDHQIEEVATGAGLDRTRSAVLRSLVTASPTLYRVTVEQRDSRGRLDARYAGLTTLSGRGSADLSRGRFLTWERVSTEETDEPLGLEAPASTQGRQSP